MLDARLLLLFGCKLSHCPHGLHFHFTKDLIENFVSKELHLVSSFDVHFVHVLKLGLALVKLVQIRHLESNTGMSFVDLDAKRILNSLNCQILTHWPELLVYPPVIGLLLLPFLTDELQRLPENLLWSHLIRVRCSSQTEIGLFKSLAITFDGHLFPVLWFLPLHGKLRLGLWGRHRTLLLSVHYKVIVHSWV